MSDNSNVHQLNALDASSFRVPASDAKGHSLYKQFRVMPAMANAMSMVIASKAFPYKTESELMRHAIQRHLRWLESIGEIDSVTAHVDAATSVLSEHQMNEDFQTLFNFLRVRVNDCVERDEHQEARKLIKKCESDFNRMPEGYWKRRFKKQLEEWDWLFRDAPTVSLVNLSND